MSAAPGTVPTKPLSKGAIFLRRLSSSLVLWGVVLGALFSSNKVVADALFLLLLLTFGGLGLVEFFQLVEKRGLACFKRWGVAGGLVLVVGLFVFVCGQFGSPRRPAEADSFEVMVLSLLVLSVCGRQFLARDNSNGLVAISTTLFGMLYVGWLLNFVVKINYYPFAHPDSARLYLLYFIAVTKFSDLGAYAVGSLIGKHKMVPRISPGKTWEGFGGALVVSTLVSLLFVRFGRETLAGMSYGHGVALGLMLAGAAVLGDLIESLFKREAGIKDSGRFFPGIGGILDLLDSLLFNAPLMYLYLRLFLVPG